MKTGRVTDSKIRSVWMVSREYDGLAGAGGVKDVCRQLAESLVSSRTSVNVVLPAYGFLDTESSGFVPLVLSDPSCSGSRKGELGVSFDIDMNYAGEDRRETVSIRKAVRNGVTVYLVEGERFSEKLGVYTYTRLEEQLRSWQHRGAGHYDYFAMNILLQKAAMALMVILGERPDVIHCQDGHTAVLAAMIRENDGYRHYFRDTGVVVTVHNAGIGYHQEVGDLHFARAVTGLPEQVVASSLLGKAFDPFVAASDYAVLNTVSEQYARELQETSEDARTGWLGHRLRQRGVTLAGVTNGINPKDFDATRGKKLGLAAGFDLSRLRLRGKKTCKESFLRALGSRRKRKNVAQFGRMAFCPEQPLLTFIGRLTSQKGVDLLVGCCRKMLTEDHDFQLLVMGSGNPELELKLTAMAESSEFAGRVCFLNGYDPTMALKVFAAGDFFLIPSLYEPCGLTDYIAQLFGNLPVVHHVGGLVKVQDGETGFAYREHTPEALREAVSQAMVLYRTDPDAIRSMQKRAFQRIRERHVWSRVKEQYFELYEQAVQMACAGHVKRGLKEQVTS